MKIVIAYYVLSAISNDHESYDMVLDEVTKWADEAGVLFSREDILNTLGLVIAKGYAKAYVKHPGSRNPEPVDFSMQNAGSFYFFVTATGKRLVQDLDQLS
jgi:hypothetical protein